MKPSVFISLFLVGFLTVLAIRAVPTHACPEGCGAASVDQAFAPTPFYYPLGGYVFPVATGAQQAAIANSPLAPLSKYMQVDGQYCTDKTGGQVYVATDAPVPDGVRCGAAASPSPSASPGSSPSAAPSGSPSASPSARPAASPSGSAAPSASPSSSPRP
jgi:hypothetical protein